MTWLSKLIRNSFEEIYCEAYTATQVLFSYLKEKYHKMLFKFFLTFVLNLLTIFVEAGVCL